MTNVTDWLLSTQSLHKSFGAVVASDALSLRVRRGEIHALIGPNGAGKTTVINQLAGELAPDAGSIHFDGHDITSWSVDRRARLGLARTFQISTLFDRLSVAENLSLGVQPRLGHSYRFWRRADRDPQLVEPVTELLERLELDGLAHRRAATLAHGDRRRLELAMALAGEPNMLLLDEPMAGTGPESSRDAARLLGNLKGRITVLLVEHDMDVVFSVADTISVMVSGKCIASGSPDAVRADPLVRQAYLGEHD
ncbi:MAG: ABC transporter ATP-binding protein [Gammaproteobacteria bacterium]|nr:MAG: ABC transporter ATP-binding protein [Gammaproteobacteria bacterium]